MAAWSCQAVVNNKTLTSKLAGVGLAFVDLCLAHSASVPRMAIAGKAVVTIDTFSTMAGSWEAVIDVGFAWHSWKKCKFDDTFVNFDDELIEQLAGTVRDRCRIVADRCSSKYKQRCFLFWKLARKKRLTAYFFKAKLRLGLGKKSIIEYYHITVPRGSTRIGLDPVEISG